MSIKAKFLSLHRLEGLTDGIYAIAMTIMVLSLPLPKTIHNIGSNSDLLDHLIDYSELFWTYLLSFLLLGNFWIIQQKLFKHVKITCMNHLWANLGGLFVVCLIPFSSSLIGNHIDYFVANIFFHTNIFLIGLFFLLQCRTLIKYPEMLNEGVDLCAIGRIIKINLVLPSLSIAGMVIALFSPAWSPLIYIFAPFLTAQIANRTRGRV
ncbi:MAG: DUF1211 domain-containing protein [Candidatus Fermentibacteraceae bacterium]|nr:DUF1211 domain-containing protein [Candidatus Fermentibacteraceae bacterium]